MRHRLVWAACAFALVIAGRTDASAQGFNFTDNVFVNVNFGSQTKGTNEASHLGLDLFLETGAVDFTRSVKGGSFIDVTGGATPLGPFGLAFNFMQRSAPGDGTLTATIPDPFFYDSPHSLSGTAEAMQHKETWFAVLVAFQVPQPVKSLKILVLAGPAVCVVEHEAVTGFTVSPTGSLVTAELALLTRDLLGYQVGADVSWLFTSHLGAGGYARYNVAKGNLGPAVKADLGGLQFGGGLRLRF